MILSSRFEFTVGIVILCWLGLVGCADVVTYSRDAQRNGVALYNEGEYAEAAGVFKNSARQDPRNYKTYYFLGACYEQMGLYQQAVHSYRTALNTLNISLSAKEDTEFRVRIINGLSRAIARSDQRDTETNASVAEAEQKNSGETWFIVAKIYSFRGDADSAIDAYNRAALLDPKNFYIQRDYGLYLEQVGQGQKAQTPLKKAYSLKSDDEELNLALRRVGIVPGPSVKPASALAKPPVPKGPIPELELKFDWSKRDQTSQSSTPSPQTTAEAPRD